MYPFALLSLPTKVIQFFSFTIEALFFGRLKKTANLLLFTNLFSKPSKNLFRPITIKDYFVTNF